MVDLAQVQRYYALAVQAFATAARDVCRLKLSDIATTHPGVHADAAPHLCLDLTYCHALLTKGFRIPEEARITLVKAIMYNGEPIEAAWPLGAAVNSLSA
jgi:apyrase